MRKFWSFLIFCFPLGFLLFIPFAHAQSGQNYYDMAVFAYENASYAEAQKYVQQALSTEPENPFYHHLLGRVYMGLEQYSAAKTHLSLAADADPDIPGLTYDLGLACFHLAEYEAAAEKMAKAGAEAPGQVLAYYYAGISYYHLKDYDKALLKLNHAAEKSTSLAASAIYFKGLCYYHTAQADEARRSFQFVIETTEDPELKQSAAQWQEALVKQQESLRKVRLYLKTGAQYDDNVRLDPVDEDIGEEEDDILFEGFFSVSYRALNNNPWQMGAGLTQYQTLHQDFDDYDLTATIGNLYARYHRAPFLFSLNYLPGYYWVSGESFLMRHQVRPELAFRINQRLFARISYNFYANNHFEDSGRDGETHSLLLDGYAAPLYNQVLLFTQLGAEYNAADDDDEQYNAARARVGVKYRLPWEIDASVSGTYQFKDYRHTDSLYGKCREDDKFKCQVSVSRPLFYEWLTLWLEYDYTDNDSNIDEFSYERHLVTLSGSVSY